MSNPTIATPPFTPVAGMVDRLDSGGFGPSAEDLEFVAAYLSIEKESASLLASYAAPEKLGARRQRKIAQRDRDWAALSQYRELNATLIGQKVDIVFIGDSITEIWGYAQPDLFAGGIVNRGISGQTSPQILLRFMPDVIALKPQAVHLMCGVNDIAGNTGPTTLADYQNNILAMLDLARVHDIQVILASLTPVSCNWRPSAVTDPGARVRQINTWLANLASDQGLIFADYRTVLADTSGDLRPDYHRDGLHPNQAGYAAMKPVVENAARQVRRRCPSAPDAPGYA